jgi:hypothetical protein
MALLGNRSVLHKSPGRFLNGRHAILRSAFNTHGMQRGAYSSYFAIAATPNGHLSPSAWVLPKTAGGMSSHNIAGITLATVGTAVGGITSPGTASITFTVSDAAGQLISSGSGSASMAFTFANALLTASLNATASASFTITGTGAIGALASGTGSASFTVSIANAQAYPLNDASPLRTGSAGLTFSGSLTPYAIGQMSGSTVDSGILTNDSIAASVWSALAAQYIDGSTMGGKLNAASSGGVDYSALGAAVWASVSRTLTSGAAPSAADNAAAVLAAAAATPIHSDARKMNGANVLGSGVEADLWRGA